MVGNLSIRQTAHSLLRILWSAAHVGVGTAQLSLRSSARLYSRRSFPMRHACLVCLVSVTVTALLPAPALAACKDVSSVRAAYNPLLFSIGSALSDLSQFSIPSSNDALELTIHMLVNDSVALAASSLGSLDTLIRLEGSMKHPEDATLIRDTVDATSPALIKLLDNQSKSINSLLPQIKALAFLQHAMQARDKIVQVMWLLKSKCS